MRVPPTYDRTRCSRPCRRSPSSKGRRSATHSPRRSWWRRRRSGRASPGIRTRPRRSCSSPTARQTAGSITPVAAAKQALKAAIPISTVSLGTAAGVVHQTVPIGTAARHSRSSSRSRSIRRRCSAVATAGGGKFYAAHSATQLDQVYKALGPPRLHQAVPRDHGRGHDRGARRDLLVGLALAYWFRLAA